MKRRLSLGIIAASIFFAVCTSTAAQEEESDIDRSSRARAAIRNHQDRIHEAKMTYLRECISSVSRTIHDLETAKRVEMRGDDLVAATAIQEQIDHFTALRDQYREALAGLSAGDGHDGDIAREPAVQLYIWNSFEANRGVAECDVKLMLDGEVVEEIESIEIEHTPNEAERSIINLPRVEFDALVIQVKEWVGHSAGITEVALVHRRRNLTPQYEIAVDHNRANRFYSPENMIDEDLDTAWFPNDGVRCEITLSKKDLDPDTVEDPDEFEDEDQGAEDEDGGGFFGLPDE